ncbi:hypothetical protein [Bremerella sp.]|uniref:hypothetical protein n=1 Tax=Bremerella sp. TaxID=2795602 RepID=UPI0039195E75
MSEFTIVCQEHPQYLQYTLSGDHTDQDWVDLLHRMAADVERTGKMRIYIDAVEVTWTDSVMLRYRVGVLTGKLFGGTTRIAALTRADDSDPLWETVASNRGAIVRLGHDGDDLLKWLAQDA